MLTRYLAKPMEAPIRMIILMFVGAAAYSAIAWLINRDAVRELAGLLRTKRSW